MSQDVPEKHTAIHIFIPGNFGSEDVGGRASGIGCAEWSMLEDVYYKYLDGQNFWSHAPVVRHEIGHNLSLFHVWGNDRCNDTNGHLSGFQPGSFDNNLMGYNTDQASMTQDQLNRVHDFLHVNQYLLSTGQMNQVLTGNITNSGNNGQLYTFNSVGSSGATVNITSQAEIPLMWSFQSGAGSFSSSNDGRTLQISGLGTLTLRAEWEDNCLGYFATVTFSSQSSSWRAIPDREDKVIVMASDEWDSVGQSNALIQKINLYTTRGELITYAYPISLGEGKYEFGLPEALPQGRYRIEVLTENGSSLCHLTID